MKRAGGVEKRSGYHFPRLFPLKRGAEYMGVTVWGIRELIWAGELPFVRPPGGRKMYIDRRDMDEFIERNKQRMT